MQITLTPEIEAALAEAARRQGTSAELLALDCLRQRFLPPGENGARPPEGESLADLLRDHIGSLSSSEHVPGGANLPENTGRRFTEELIRKRNQGRSRSSRTPGR